MMEEIIYKVVFYLLILKLVMTMYQRKYGEDGEYKRVLSLYQSIYIGVLYVVITILHLQHLSLTFQIIGIIVWAIAGYLLRKRLFDYDIKCEKCGNKLSFTHILFLDSKICTKCEL